MASQIFGQSVSFDLLNAIKVEKRHEFFSSSFTNQNRSNIIAQSKTLSLNDFLGSALYYMATCYVDAICELQTSRTNQVIFAGGVGQKCRPLVANIIERLGQANYIVSREIETTLAGLREISKFNT